MLLSVSVLADGHFSAIKRLYLDTSVLLHQLTRRTPKQDKADPQAKTSRQ
jgi:hypothetical protein